MDKTHLMPNAGGEDAWRKHHQNGHAEGQESRYSHHNPSDMRNAPRPGPPAPEPHRKPRKLVLCFDGTGNKFHGDDSDSNILKIFRMLDRTADDQCKFLPDPRSWENTATSNGS